jgi:hypothetical protein
MISTVEQQMIADVEHVADNAHTVDNEPAKAQLANAAHRILIQVEPFPRADAPLQYQNH